MSDNTPQDSQPISFDRVLDILNQGRIEAEHGLMRWSSNYAFLVTVSLEEEQLMAVYKPHKGERPLWDFPDGMLCQREMASFLVSEALGWQIVPPTALRGGPHGIGTVQFYVDHDPEENYFTFAEDVIPQMMRMCAFDILVNNADRKGGHCLLDSEGHVWGIDHGISFHSAPKLRTVIWDFAGQPIPAPLMSDIDQLCKTLDDCENPLSKGLAELLTEREVTAFRSRITQLQRTRKYPQPGPGGPNYPWPPV
jgi:uncharacterized repeat protein (TIGR03843 family)